MMVYEIWKMHPFEVELIWSRARVERFVIHEGFVVVMLSVFS